MFIRNRLGMIESVETLLAQEHRMNQIANNLANVDTTGFKKENITFWEMMFKAHDNRNRVGKGLKVITNHAPGATRLTGNQLDMAIEGNGFFKVQTPDGIRYTRAGNFRLNDAGQMITPDGFLVMGEGGPVVIEGKNVTVNLKGGIIVDGELVNQMAIAGFEDLSVLKKEGLNLFRLKDATIQEQPIQNFQVQQGYLEEANVDITTELTEMIDLQRAYEAQQKVVQTIDDMDGQAISRVGKLTE